MKLGFDQHVHQDLEVKGHPWELKEEKRNVWDVLNIPVAQHLERTARMTP